MTNVSITGGAALAEALRKLPVELEVKVMRASLRGGAREIQREAQSRAPVRTGKLRASIKVRSRKNTATGYLNYYVTAGDRKKGGAYYASMVEGGTKAHDIRPRGAASLFIAGVFRRLVRHPGAKERPFMAPAFAARAAQAIDTIARLTAEGIAKIVRKGA